MKKAFILDSLPSFILQGVDCAYERVARLQCELCVECNDELMGPNFHNWERNLHIVLQEEQKWYILENPIGLALTANAPTGGKNAHQRHINDISSVGCLILATMAHELQRHGADKDVLVNTDGKYGKNKGKWKGKWKNKFSKHGYAVSSLMDTAYWSSE
ncbi:hypothetical protein Tco_0419118 [Tanacetum coccineum]